MYSGSKNFPKRLKVAIRPIFIESINIIQGFYSLSLSQNIMVIK